MPKYLEHVHDFELVLDHDRHRATRGSGPSVDFGGKVCLWKLLTALARRYDAYFRANDLISDVWGGYLVERETLWSAIHDLRKILRPLDLNIKHEKGLGYRLQDLRGS